MVTPGEIYAAYRIMPGLQAHQLRVAAVGKMICDNFSLPVNSGDVILTCLFHDMGNIIKSDLGSFPEFLGAHDRAYWEQVKKEYIGKYGDYAHDATLKIMGEMGLGKHIIDMSDHIGFSRLEGVRDSGSHELKIAEYADLRAGPHGVLPMKDRIAEGRLRYKDLRPWAREGGADEFERLRDAAREIERQIFAHAGIAPDDITDDAVAPIIEDLRQYSV